MLDHDIQQLVFKNYSKFMNSVEVIKTMRIQIDQNMDKINDIENMFESIE